MKQFKNVITLNKNSRGCYILDTVKGCSYVGNNPGGCYGDCYANHIASRYGMNFSDPVRSDFIRSNFQLYFDGFLDTSHESYIIKSIKKIDMPFVRIGEMGDPSEDWEHTINVCNIIKHTGKKIVIITKHWNTLPDYLLDNLDGLYINTSISALDTEQQIEHRLRQYKRLKRYCNSIMRVVTCDFNDIAKGKIQCDLLNNENVIDTVFRPSNGNRLIKDGTINVKKVKFLRSSMLASMHSSNVYFGMCDTCPDMCGINFF
jgi:hypothetical protein